MKRIKQPNGSVMNQAEPGDVLNPYGRPTKLVSQVLKDLKEAGAEAVSPSQVSDVITVLLNLPVEMVRKIAEDKKLPILIQRTARRFAGSSDKDWDWILSNNLDRAHGKAKSSTDITTNGKDITTNPLDGLSVERQAEIILELRRANANK